MTIPTLEEMRALCELATEWQYDRIPNPMTYGDAAFIIAARSFVPWAIENLENLRSDLNASYKDVLAIHEQQEWMRGEIDRLRAENEQLRTINIELNDGAVAVEKENTAMRALIREAEYGGVGYEWRECPWCHRVAETGNGHADDCKAVPFLTGGEIMEVGAAGAYSFDVNTGQASCNHQNHLFIPPQYKGETEWKCAACGKVRES